MKRKTERKRNGGIAKFFPIFIFLSSLLISSVHAQDTTPSLAIVVTPSLTSARADVNTPQETGISEDREFGWGGGVLVDSPLTPMFSLSAGALYIQRTFEVATSAIRIEREVPTLFFPVELRVWLGNILSVGGGGFIGVRVGDVSDTVVTGAGNATVTSDPDRSSFEYGLTASANLLFPVSERTGLLIGARYLYGLSDAAKSALYDEKIDDLALQAGLSFSL